VIEKLPQRHIANLLGIKPASVGTYVSRGKEEFRQIYYRMMNEMQKVRGERRNGNPSPSLPFSLSEGVRAEEAETFSWRSSYQSRC
jgi:hypothetical protein